MDFLWRRLAAPDHANRDARAGLATEKIHGLAHRHVAGRKSADGLENIAAANSRLRARAIWKHGEDNDVTIALAEREARFASAHIRQLFLVFLVFAWRQITGLRVDRFTHPVQGPGTP